LDRIDRLFEILVRANLRVGLVTCVVAVGSAILLRIVLGITGFPFITFFPAVLVSAFVGGLLPGSLAALASITYAALVVSLPASSRLGPLPVGGLVGAVLVFGTQIGSIEVIRVAARRAETRRIAAAALLAERNTMFHELQHRVANNMQFISSLLSLQSRAIPSGGPGRDAMQDAAQRLMRFATIHRKLHDDRLAERGFAALAREVLQELLLATGCDSVILDITADEVPLPLATITTLLLVTTEAATNAVKHVFTAGRGNHLTVHLGRQGADTLELVIADDGPGYPPGNEPGTAGSLGIKIMQSFISRLQGQITMRSAPGAEVRVLFPRPAVDSVTRANLERTA
jgi:two-component sensor histidine kinase